MASPNAIILAAAMSAVSKNQVITLQDYINRKSGNVTYKELDTDALHQSHLVGGPVPNNDNTQNLPQGSPDNGDEMIISIKPLSGKAFKIKVKPTTTIYQVKQKVQDEQGILPESQRLLFQGYLLDDGRSVISYEILENAEVFLILRQRGGDEIFYIHSDHLDPPFDFDFTEIRDKGKTYMRGGIEYKRPYGWKRIALKVLNKYGDNVWLGMRSKRGGTDSVQNEWPVSYHGTSRHNNNTIAEDGFNYGRNRNFNFSHGIYSIPDVNVAIKYATKFVHNGQNYAVLFQNRVNPNTLQRITAQETGSGEYWISPNGGDVRSYGICIKKI
ncbi:12641_t:CDS:1 [Funneliformis mosseae]|uniref:12641_t:CDS:1 n=1 Tax=Funneliformis mosseae TaxID=27381 RepID=A0A9N9H0A9_FUNMO|nr:12641_t:CDS:1 [Funneliformis mosseae]